jgi:outer membrane autotransporter protein
VSNGINFMPANVAGAYTSVLTIGSGATITRGDYPAVTLNSDGLAITSWDVTVNVEEGASASAHIQDGSPISGVVFVNVTQIGDVTINNSGIIDLSFATLPSTAAGYWVGAIDGRTGGGDVLVVNSATGIVTSEMTGLYADSDNGAATVQNDGTVSSRAEAIRVIARGGNAATVVNNGTLTATEQAAVVAWTDLGSVSVTNTGTVNALNSVGLQGWSTADTATVINAGTINADEDPLVADKGSNNHAGIDVRALLDEPEPGDPLVGYGDAYGANTATGRIIATAGYGINGYARRGTVTLRNDGLIASKGGLMATSVAGDAGLTNTGTIIATGAASPVAIALDVSGTATVANSGTIHGGFSTVGGTNTFDNTGTWFLLSDDSVDGYAMAATSGTWAVGGTTTFNNSGTFGIETVGGQATVSGALALNNLAGGTLTLASGADLTLSGGSLANAGTIDLANGTADNTISVGGTYSSAAGSVLAIDVDAAGNTDTIVAGGNVSVAGTVAVSVLTGDYSTAKTYTIVRSTGGTVSGSYDGFAKDYAYFNTTLSYDADSVDLTVVRSSATLGGVVAAGHRNARNAADAIGSLPTSHPLYLAALQFSRSEVGSAYGQLSGDAHATYLSGLASDSRYVRDATISRLRQAFGDVGAAGGMALGYGEGGPAVATPAAPFAVWTQGFGAVAHSEDDNAGRETRRTLGTAIGADAFVPFGNQVWRVGIAGAYAANTARISERNASADIDAYSGMVYAGTELGAWAVRLGASGTWNKIDSTRRVVASTIEDTLTADYWARTWQAFGEVGYRTKLAGIEAEPFAGLSYVVVDSDDATESGATTALALDSATQQLVYSTLGLRLRHTVGLVTLNGSAAWRHGFGDVASDVTARFLTGGDSFAIQGVDTGADAALISAGASVQLSPSATASVAYDGTFGSDGTEHGGRAELRLRF